MGAYEDLTEILNEAVREALEDTANEFRLSNEPNRQSDYEYQNNPSDLYHPQRNPAKYRNADDTYENYSKSDYPQNLEKPNQNPTFKNPYYKNVEKPINYQTPQTPDNHEFHIRPDRYDHIETSDNRKTDDYVERRPYRRIVYDSGESNEAPRRPAQAQKEPATKNEPSPKVVSREAWGARPALGVIPNMKPPIELTVFSVNTGTPPCYNDTDCRRAVKTIQARHMGRGLADIQYNFLVGGDGKLYEGRGLFQESDVAKLPGEGSTYNFAFIGNYDEAGSIPKNMLYPVRDFITWANDNRLMIGDTNRKDLN